MHQRNMDRKNMDRTKMHQTNAYPQLHLAAARLLDAIEARPRDRAEFDAAKAQALQSVRVEPALRASRGWLRLAARLGRALGARRTRASARGRFSGFAALLRTERLSQSAKLPGRCARVRKTIRAARAGIRARGDDRAFRAHRTRRRAGACGRAVADGEQSSAMGVVEDGSSTQSRNNERLSRAALTRDQITVKASRNVAAARSGGAPVERA